MKKIVIAVVALVVVAAVVLVLVLSNLGAVIKSAVGRFGSEATKSNVALADADVSLTSGEGKLQGLTVANPEGFSKANAFELGLISVKLDPDSVTTDTIVVKEVVIEGPKVLYELDTKLSSNLGRIQENVDAYTKSLGGGGGGASKPKAGGEPKASGGETKFVIEHVYVRGGQVSLGTTVTGAATCPLPEIHLKDIGKKSGGATAGEVTAQILSAITDGSLRAAAENGLTKGAKGVIDSAVDKVKNIFK